MIPKATFFPSGEIESKTAFGCFLVLDREAGHTINSSLLGLRISEAPHYGTMVAVGVPVNPPVITGTT